MLYLILRILALDADGKVSTSTVGLPFLKFVLYQEVQLYIVHYELAHCLVRSIILIL